MIILKHITIERFRLLRALNLHFPQRGSILIQGPNEAGKSALIESIYFALYGEPLSLKRGKRSLDDLISYGATDALVTLTLSIGTTELIIERTLRRGMEQQASLTICPLGMAEEEPIIDLQTVNQRIVAEMGGISADTLRNSSLIEQKRLGRLEAISGTEREDTMRKLLGLESFLELAEQFHVTDQDEISLSEAVERLQLAECQARIPEISQQLEEIEQSLDAVSIDEQLASIDQQENEINELDGELEEIESRRLELKSHLSRVQYLKKADGTLAEIITAYDEIAEAREALPRLEEEILELEHLEREELPKLEKRVNDLAELTRSFGTLQRMSNDLLTIVDTIKALEQELRDYSELKQDLRNMEDLIAQTRVRLVTTQQTLREMDETRRTLRPRLDARLQRLHVISERLAALKRAEDQYKQRLSKRGTAATNASQLQKVQVDLYESEQEQALMENEAQQVQAQADALEQAWRQLNIRRYLEEWYRLKGLSQGLVEAEQNVNQARQQQAQLTKVMLNMRNSAMQYMMYTIIGGVICLIALVVGLILLSTALVVAGIVIVIALTLAITAFVFYQKYRSVRLQEQAAKKQEQESISRVGMMVSARENAMRMAGNNDTLYRIENEIQSLGGTLPQTLDEAQRILESSNGQGDLDEIQQRMKDKIDEANAARNQVNGIVGVVAGLRKDLMYLEEQRKREQLDNFEELLITDRAAIELMLQKIAQLASQENFPQPSINARRYSSPIVGDTPSFSGLPSVLAGEDLASIPTLENLVESTLQAVEHEISELDGKVELARELSTQAEIQQKALDAGVDNQHSLEMRLVPYIERDPQEQLERAREQQVGLQGALQTLRDSLRQRVKPLGITFLQSAVSNAETDARKQLEELHFNLDNKILLQERQAHYTVVLHDRQESLSEYYKQLAKFSNTLGSWIVPLNPFAEALINLRNRCQQELIEANEEGLLQEVETLQVREVASNLRIELCKQDVEGAETQIIELLSQRNRPQPQAYTREQLIIVWPLVGEHTTDDRARLEEEHNGLEKELASLEQQELILSQRLNTGTNKLDLAEEKLQLEQRKNSYHTKKYGNKIIHAVHERLLGKVLPHTEHYMQQILPLLTGRRYHDVHLLTETEEGATSGGPIQIQVWDASAGEYLPSSSLSAGAADQISLALRLAFAVSTLPRELNAALGFVILDEPLSSFDRGRTQALVDVVTGDILSQHFEQILLVSHNNAFDPAMFPYHLYMDNGLVVESNFPVLVNPSIETPFAEDLTPETPQPETDISVHNEILNADGDEFDGEDGEITADEDDIENSNEVVETEDGEAIDEEDGEITADEDDIENSNEVVETEDGEVVDEEDAEMEASEVVDEEDATVFSQEDEAQVQGEGNENEKASDDADSGEEQEEPLASSVSTVSHD